MITQTRFLGASVRGFTGTVGWNSSPSTLAVQLVEDTVNGDVINIPTNKSPATFTMNTDTDTFTFRGLIDNWIREDGASGRGLYTVQMIDPRVLFDGVQIILDGYNGGVYNVPNLYNVYGFWESQVGYGAAQVNESGMPWLYIRSAMQSMTEVIPIRYGSHSYTLDLTRLPLIPDWFRIGGTHVTLSQFIQEVCEAGQHDYFVNLEDNVIVVYTISRASQPSLNGIERFINSFPGEKIDYSRGLETRQDIMNKFVVGGQREELWGQHKNGGQDINATIWPWWGLDTNGNPLIGYDVDNNHNVDIDTTNWGITNLPNRYNIDVEECRHVLAGFEVWETYIWENKYDLGESIGLVFQHHPDADLDVDNSSISKLPTSPEQLARIEAIHEEFWYQNAQKFFSSLSSFVSEFYGKKFWVKMPITYSKTIPESVETKVSWSISDGGFVEESEWDNAIRNKRMPPDINRVLTQDGKISAFVRFDSANQYDFADIPEDDIIWKDYRTAFVRCSVEDKVYFLNNDSKDDPVAVIVLPGTVIYGVLDEDFGPTIAHLNAALGDRSKGRDVTNVVPNYGINGTAILPSFATVPLKSDIYTYGPWYATGGGGITEYEQADDLVPWNYGGYALMNQAGNAKVLAAASTMESQEVGSISMPGIPKRTLGQLLFAGGPYITDLDCSLNESGLRTTMKFRTWAPSFGKLLLQSVDRIRRFGKYQQHMRRQFRNIGSQNSVFNLVGNNIRNFQNNANNIIGGFNKTVSTTTSNFMLHARYTTLGTQSVGAASSTKCADIACKDPYATIKDLSHDFESNFSCSLDAMFVPYTTDTSVTTYPHLEEPNTNDSGDINSLTLNPFKDSNIQYVTHGANYSDSFNKTLDPEKTRSFALRGPLMISSPLAYDKDGEKLDTETKDPSTWKTGPLDVRWDDEKKVWAASGGGDSNLKIGYCSNIGRQTGGRPVGGTMSERKILPDGRFTTGESVPIINVSSSLIITSSTLVITQGFKDTDGNLLNVIIWADC